MDNGSFTQLGSQVTNTYVTTQAQRLRRSGNDVIYSQAGVDVITRTDTTYTTTGNDGAFIFAADLILDSWTNNVSAGQNIDVGLSSETDTALAVGKSKAKAVGLASETDTALAVSHLRLFSVGLATETDSAFAVAKRKAKAVGLATSTDSAFAVTSTGGGDVPTSYYTAFPDTENPIDQDGMFRVGTETAFYGTPRSTPGKCFAATFVGEIAADYDDCLAHLINHAVPVDQRVTGTVFRQVGYDPEDNHELALYLFMEIGAEFVRGYEFLWNTAGSFQIVIWLGTDHDLDNFDTSLSLVGAGPGTPADGDELAVQVVTDGSGNHFEVFKNSVSVGTCDDEPATWTDGNPGMGFFVRPGDTTLANYGFSSWSVTADGIFQPVGICSETDTAFAVSHIKLKQIGLSTETDSALAMSHLKTFLLGLATETDSAFAAVATHTVPVGLATETSSAFSVGHSKRRTVGLAEEFDTAQSVVQFGAASGGYAGMNMWSWFGK